VCEIAATKKDQRGRDEPSDGLLGGLMDRRKSVRCTGLRAKGLRSGLLDEMKLDSASKANTRGREKEALASVARIVRPEIIRELLVYP
jgi:hypothetical protein